MRQRKQTSPSTPEGWLQLKMAKAAEELKLGEVSSSQNSLPVAKRFTLKEIYELVERANGNTKAICAALDCTRSQWQAYMAKHPDIPELCKQAREALVDKAEQVVASLLDSQNEAIQSKTAEFLLTTLGKSRGYDKAGPAQQISIEDGKVDIKTIFGIQ